MCFRDNKLPLTADLQVSDLNTELNDLLGLPLDTKLDLQPMRRSAPIGVRWRSMSRPPGQTIPKSQPRRNQSKKPELQ